MEANLGECVIHFVERLFAEVRNAQQVFPGAVQQVVDCEDAFFFEAIGRADGQADFGRAHLEPILHTLIGEFSMIEWNAGHRGFPP